MTRREARELAFSLLYELTFFPEKDPEELYRSEQEMRPFEEDDYVKTVVVGAAKSKEQIDALVERYSNGWKVKRISRISLAILRLCIYEMLYVEDIPFSVSINEAVELARQYSTEKAPQFINGVLGAIARDGQ